MVDVEGRRPDGTVKAEAALEPRVVGLDLRIVSFCLVP